jgi:hypothetical protein
MSENEAYRDLSEAVISAAERYVRELAKFGDLASPRVRRRLRIAVEELSRVRQVFAADEEAELGELSFDVNDRDQPPDLAETASQRMVRELVSMLPAILGKFTERAPSIAFPLPDVMAGIALESAIGAEIVKPEDNT